MATPAFQVAGRPAGLGNVLPDRRTTKYGWPVFGEVPNTAVIPRSQWQPTDLSAWCSAVKNQGQTNACNAFTTVECMEATRRVQGLPDVVLSPGWLYGNINGQRDQGSVLEDALQWAVRYGTPPASVVPELAWQKSRWPAGAQGKAAAYRMTGALWCPTADHLVSAVMSGRFGNVGLMWYRNYNAGQDGWLPPRGQGLLGGHSVTVCGAYYSERLGQWGLKVQNHWGREWGVGGYGIIPLSALGGPVGGWWACVDMTDEGGVVPAPAGAVQMARQVARAARHGR